jgi:hypothetical protein
MKNEKKVEPWNDQNTPMSKHGARWAVATVVIIGSIIFLAMILFAVFSK